MFRVAQDGFDRQFDEQKKANEQLFNLTDQRLNSPPKNYGDVCFDWFEITDINKYMAGTGFNKTGLTFGEWVYSQTPLTSLISLILGPLCLIGRYVDTRIASKIAKNVGLKLHFGQKVKKHKYLKITLNRCHNNILTKQK